MIDYDNQFKEHEEKVVELANIHEYVSPSKAYQDADWMIALKSRQPVQLSCDEELKIEYLNSDFMRFAMAAKIRWVEVKKRFKLMCSFSLVIGKPLAAWNMEDLILAMTTVFPSGKGEPVDRIPEIKESVNMNDTMTAHEAMSTIRAFVTQVKKYLKSITDSDNYMRDMMIDDYREYFPDGKVIPQLSSREVNFAVEKYYLILNPYKSRMNALLDADRVMRNNLDPKFHLYVCTVLRVCLCGLPSNDFLDLKWKHLLPSENFNDYISEGKINYELAGQQSSNGVNLLLKNNNIVTIDNETIEMLYKSYQIDYLRKGWKFEGPDRDSAIKFSTFNDEEKSPKLTKQKATIKICHLFINYIVKFGGPNIGPVYVNKRGLYEKLVEEFGIEEARKMISFDPKNQSPLRTNSLLLFAIKNGEEITDIALFKRKMLEIVY